jgi:glycyl-tRNA synthetase beta chain
VAVLAEAKGRDDFVALATTFKRVVNILPPADRADEFAPPEDLGHDAGIRLRDAFREVNERAPGLLKAREYGKLFVELRKLKAPVDRFFEQVRVMDADNPGLRAQRLGLLKLIADLFYEIADFSKIVVEQESQS